MYYQVSNGGPDKYRYEDQDEAMAACWELAKQQAVAAEDCDPDEQLIEWGDDANTGWGVCPEGSDGAYWPQVEAYNDCGCPVSSMCDCADDLLCVAW
jgi:hypothetical protein